MQRIQHLLQKTPCAGMLRMGEKLGRRGDLENVAAVDKHHPVGNFPANCISWVTTSMVIPLWARVFITCSTSPIISGSSAEVGSSNRIICGEEARARAIATRCCWPPESCAGICCAFSSSPTWRSSASARS
ncbi:Protein of uncharacterised function (DUF1602) [Klebsiella variicola]|nr:Protein of uncharacterised function (DUF1602) [Klebsiella variicola]